MWTWCNEQHKKYKTNYYNLIPNYFLNAHGDIIEQGFSFLSMYTSACGQKKAGVEADPGVHREDLY